MRKKKKKKPRLTHPYALYEAAVQGVSFDIYFFSRYFAKRMGRKALHMREDFCGTFALSKAWVESDKRRTALAIDLAKKPLNYGRKNHWNSLSREAKKRLQVQQKNVLSRSKKMDLILAQNFSYFTFQTRAELLRYFRFCYSSLQSDGVFCIDIFGGPESEIPRMEKQIISSPKHETFLYYWDLQSFDPIHRRAHFSIHFRIKPNKMIRNAFRYDWRMWTIPELKEILSAAGFSSIELLWEGENATYRKVEKAENDPTWLAYIFAAKDKKREMEKK